LLLLDFKALVSLLSVDLPSLHKVGLIVLEKGDHVVCWQVVLLKLLNNNQDEQIEHHVGARQDNEEEIDPSEFVSACLHWHAVGNGPAAVEHNLVPILSSGNSKEKQE